ncbi:hypothetical protein D3C76_641090 [compost metagenome]
MGQGLSNTARAMRLRTIEADHRCTFRQSIPFVDRQAHPFGTPQQIPGHPGAAHGGKTQVPWVEGFLLGSTDEHQQQLRHQDQALGRPAGQASQQLGHIHTAGPLDPQGLRARQAQSRTGIQRRITTDVLQQNGERQQRQMVLRVGGLTGQVQLATDPQDAVCTQAHPFGRTRGTGSESQLGRAFRHPVRAAEGAAPELAVLVITRREQFVVQMRLGNDPFGAALLQAMSTLRRAEKARQGHTGQAGEQCSQIPEHGVNAVVQRQGHDLDLFIAQSLLAVHYFGIQRGVVQFQLIAPQRYGVCPTLGMLAQGLHETFHFRRHRSNPHWTLAIPGG